VSVKHEPVLIRVANAADAKAILGVYAPYVIDTAISFEEEPPSVEEMADRIESGHLWLVAEVGAEILGYAYAAPFHRRPAYRWSVEVSIYLAETATGRGVGKLLLSELLERLRQQGFVNAFAGTTLPNARSLTLFETFGFKKIAHQEKVGFKLLAWHDVVWMELQLQERTVPPPELRPQRDH
jgi:L-amino acid N-acyltransferase YncA